jgi:ubiquitin-protein ligase
MEIQNQIQEPIQQTQIQNNDDIYSHYKNTFLKRWNIELLDFYKKKEYKNIQINLCNDKIRIKIDNYTFLLTNKYPFYPPKVMIQNNPYLNYLKYPTSERIQNILHVHKISCMCCSSISNRNMWSPAYQINDILNEIKRVNQIKKYVKHYLIVDDICRTKNIDTDTIGMLILEFLECIPIK